MMMAICKIWVWVTKVEMILMLRQALNSYQQKVRQLVPVKIKQLRSRDRDRVIRMGKQVINKQ